MEKDHDSTSEWTCHACLEPQKNIIFHTNEDFTSHLEQAHCETIKSQQIEMLSSLWARKIVNKIESCPICGFREERQADTLDHIAKHIHAFSLRSLPWGPNDDESCIQDHDDYFKSNPYFAERSEGSVSGDEGTSSSDGEKMDTLPALDDSQILETEEIPLASMSMTENHVSKVPELFIGEEDVAGWMANIIGHLPQGDTWEKSNGDIERRNGDTLNSTASLSQGSGTNEYTLSKELIDAAKSGREQDVENLVSQAGVDPDCKDDKNCTPLLHAVSKGHEKVVKVLLNTGNVNVNVKVDEIGTPLSSAAKQGNFQIVQLLIDNGAEVNLPDSSLRTPLSRAAARGNNEVVKFLLEKGAEIDSPTLASRMPLLSAARYGRLQTVELLLDKGADITGTSASGKTALARAAAYGHEEVVKILVERDVNVDSNKTKRLTVALIEAIKKGRSAVVHLLLNMGADIASADGPNQTTPLEFAVAYEDELIVKILLDHCAPFDLYQETINSALVRAINYGRFDNVSCVLPTARANADNISWTNALEHAAAGGHKSILKLLLNTHVDHYYSEEMTEGVFCEAVDEKQELFMRKHLLGGRVDFRFPNHRGRIPLLYAACRGYESIVKASLDQGVHSKNTIHEALVGATRTGHTHIVQLMLKKGVDANAPADRPWRRMEYRSPLDHAVITEHVDIAKLLLESGADTNGGGDGFSIPLHDAIKQKHLKLAQLLISHGADVNLQNKIGAAALHIAAANGSEELVQLLLESGADINKQNESKLTPLYLAAERNHVRVVHLLIDRGAKVDTPDNEGITPFHAATKSTKDIALSFLEQAKTTELHPKARPVALSLAAREGQCDTIQVILDQGEDVNVKDWRGRTALFWAANSGCTDAVHLLLDRGADPNCQPTSGQTILAVAAKKGQSEIVKLLLKNGADPNAQDEGKRYIDDEEGTTPLYWAVINGHGPVARLLLDNGADANYRDRSWGSIIQVARRSVHTDLVDLLKEYGAR